MKSRDFAFWLQGFFELGGGSDGLTAQQVAVVKQHLGLVFQHDTEIAAKPHAQPAPNGLDQVVTGTGGVLGQQPLIIC